MIGDDRFQVCIELKKEAIKEVLTVNEKAEFWMQETSPEKLFFFLVFTTFNELF